MNRPTSLALTPDGSIFVTDGYEAVVELAPGKPIRYLVNTHDHYDHLGGLRTYLHIGATVITHQRNRMFYESELLHYAPRALEPDLVSLYPPTELAEGYTMEDVDEKYILGDGSRTLELYCVQGLGDLHAEGMLLAYLPQERILIEADLHDPGPLPGDRERLTPLEKALRRNVRGGATGSPPSSWHHPRLGYPSVRTAENSSIR